MEGKRLRDNQYPANPGEYSKIVTDKGTFWFVLPPNVPGNVFGSLTHHDIKEHEDGTITVAEEISYASFDGSTKWRGTLTKGVWKEC